MATWQVVMAVQQFARMKVFDAQAFFLSHLLPTGILNSLTAAFLVTMPCCCAVNVIDHTDDNAEVYNACDGNSGVASGDGCSPLFKNEGTEPP